MDKIIIDRLAEDIRSGTVTPQDALELMRQDKVLVWDAKPEASTWGEVEDRAASTTGLHHALQAVGAADLSDQFSKEVVRLREAGQVIDNML